MARLGQASLVPGDPIEVRATVRAFCFLDAGDESLPPVGGADGPHTGLMHLGAHTLWRACSSSSAGRKNSVTCSALPRRTNTELRAQRAAPLAAPVTGCTG